MTTASGERRTATGSVIVDRAQEALAVRSTQAAPRLALGGRLDRQGVDRRRPADVRLRRLPAVGDGDLHGAGAEQAGRPVPTGGHRRDDVAADDCDDDHHRPGDDIEHAARTDGWGNDVARNHDDHPGATTTGPDTVPYPFAPPEVGSVLARLEIPSIKVDYMIVQGVGVDELAKGPGHFPESALPGQLGNTAIAGHRTTHGAPLYDIDELDPGDTIVITYPPIGGEQGPQFTYVVTGTEIVSPNDYADVVPSTDPTRATLALVSCHPVRSASHRMVVRAELDPARSSTLFAATAPAGFDEPQVLPGDDTESTPVSTAATTSEVPQSVGPTTAGADDRGPGDGAEHARPVVAATGSEPGRVRRRLVRRQLGVAADHPVGPGPPGDLRRRLPAGPTHSTNLAGHARVVRPVRHRLVLLVREHQPAAPAGPLIRTLTFTSRRHHAGGRQPGDRCPAEQPGRSDADRACSSVSPSSTLPSALCAATTPSSSRCSSRGRSPATAGNVAP